MFLYRLIFLFLQMIFTTLVVMALVLFLVGFLPDFSSFSESGDENKSYQLQLKEEDSNLNRNQIFWKNVIYNDLGQSRLNSTHSVGEILRKEGKISLILFLTSLFSCIILSSILGTLSGYFNNMFLNSMINYSSLLMSSLPSFLLVPILVYGLAIYWPIFPAALWEGPKSLVLPTLALSLRSIFYLSRILRDQLIENKKADYVKVAISKGFSNRYVFFIHILPLSLTPYIVGIGSLFGQLVTGSFLIETLFALPGLGSLFVRVLMERDYPIFLALVLLFTVTLQLGHRISDLILTLIGETKFAHKRN